FLQAAELFGGDRLLAQGVEQGAQLGGLVERAGHAYPSCARVRLTHSNSPWRIFASALYTASTERPTAAAVDWVVAPSANRRASSSRSRGRSFSTQRARASRRSSSCRAAACSTAVSATRSSRAWLNRTRLRWLFL